MPPLINYIGYDITRVKQYHYNLIKNFLIQYLSVEHMFFLMYNSNVKFVRVCECWQTIRQAYIVGLNNPIC